MREQKVFVKSAPMMVALGKKVASYLKGGEILGLTGPLGAGKTTFVQGLAAGLGVKEKVTSASFILAQSFPGRIWLHHLDLYRLNEAEVKRLLLWGGYFDEDSVLVIEWAEKAHKILPKETRYLYFSYFQEGREIKGKWPEGFQW